MDETSRDAGVAGWWKPWAVFAAGFVALATVAAAWGGPHGVTDGLAWVMAGMWHGVIVSAPVLGAAWGLGGWLNPVVRGAREGAALRMGAGLGLLLAVWFVLGTVGMLSAFAAWGVVGLAVTRLVVDVIESRGTLGRFPRRPAGWAWAGLLGFCVLFVAASSPVGALWRSEYGAYDAMSYHLPLAQAWIAEGRVWPVEHSVYSYLPLAVESLYAWAGVLTGASGERGLLSDGGWRLVGMQHLHAWITVVGVWMVAAAGRRGAAAAGLSSRGVRTAGWVAGGLAGVTPWLVVVGSVAYNEAGVVALGAAGLIAAFEPRLSAWRRGVLCGGLVGVACLVKPTAIVLVGPAVGAAMVLGAVRRGGGSGSGRAVLTSVGVAAGVGLLALSPWLIRNAVVTGGNPVFPLMTDTFGAGHWDEAQADRWDRAHAAEGGIADRLVLAVWTDPDAPADAESVARWRGVTNAQWGVFFGSVVVGGAIAVIGGRRKRGRWVAGVLAVGLGVSLVGWLTLTHIQSRFLVPAIPAGAVLVALGVGVVGRGAGSSRLGVIGGGVVALQATALVFVWTTEAGGRPNRLLAVGTPVLLGQNYTDAVGEASPPAWVNAALPDDAKVLMIGDAAVLYFDRDLVWTSVWDRASALPEGSGWQRAWTGALAENEITHLFVNLGEVGRQLRSGYSTLTPEEVIAWAQRQGPIVRVWPDAGIVVVAVDRR